MAVMCINEPHDDLEQQLRELKEPKKLPPFIRAGDLPAPARQSGEALDDALMTCFKTLCRFTLIYGAVYLLNPSPILAEEPILQFDWPPPRPGHVGKVKKTARARVDRVDYYSLGKDNHVRRKRISRKAMYRLCQHPYIWNHRQYYDSVRSASRSVVESCIQKKKNTNQNRIDHSGYGKQLCKKRWYGKDLYKGFYYRYRLSFKNDPQNNPHIRMGMNIRLNIYADKKKPARLKFILNRARACIPHIRNVWKRYRVDFRLRIDSSSHPIPGFKPPPKNRVFQRLILPFSARFNPHRNNKRGFSRYLLLFLSAFL